MTGRPFVPLNTSVSTLLSEMASELLARTKGRRLGPEKLAELIDAIAYRYTAHVILRFHEMQDRQMRASQSNESAARVEGIQL